MKIILQSGGRCSLLLECPDEWELVADRCPVNPFDDGKLADCQAANKAQQSQIQELHDKHYDLVVERDALKVCNQSQAETIRKLHLTINDLQRESTTLRTMIDNARRDLC